MEIEGGGVIEAIKQMASVHAAQGHSIEIATLDSYAPAGAQAFPGRVHTLGRRQSSYGYSRRFVPWLRSNFARFDAVLVNGIWQYASYAVWRALRHSGVPYFVIPHGMLDPWFKQNYLLKHLKKQIYWTAFERRVLRDAQAVIFTSEEERTAARKSFRPYACRERVAPLGIASPSGDADEQRSRFLEAYPHLRGRRLILFLGRLHEKKGLDLLLRAFAKIARDHSSFHLVLAGPSADPRHLAGLHELALSLGLDIHRQQPSSSGSESPTVSFLPMLSGAVKWGAFHSAEAFVLPSHQENFGIAVVEALACGVPVLISNRVNIWREIEEDGAGFVEDDTAEGVGRLLTRWLEPGSEERRMEMSARAKTCFQTRFEAQKAGEAFIRLLETEIGSGKPTGRAWVADHEA